MRWIWPLTGFELFLGLTEARDIELVKLNGERIMNAWRKLK